MRQTRFSFIIAVYNAERYLKECLDSVLAQTYPTYEIILCNDGSTDGSEAVIKKYLTAYPSVRYIKQANQGQGVARNAMLDKATGDYVVILDSDDWIEPIFLETCQRCIDKEDPDMVHFEFKRQMQNGKTLYSFVNYRYAGKDRLLNRECEALLSNREYYTWTSLYKLSFLRENTIRYGEGYIYEDHEFYIKACLCASKIGLVHSPLYNYRIHSTSTIQNKAISKLFHYKSEISALQKSLQLIATQAASEQAKAYIANHAFSSFMYCFNKKTPFWHRYAYTKQFVDLMAGLVCGERKRLSKHLQTLYGKQAFTQHRYGYVFIFTYYWLVKYGTAKYTRLQKPNAKKCALWLMKSLLFKWPLQNDLILFLGFDYRYAGNSKYLYDQMKVLYPQYRYRFVTRDEAVPEPDRILKRSVAFIYCLACAKVVIHESYALAGFPKRAGQIWLQTWHATTIKKLLFDTSEPFTNKKNYRQKIAKYNTVLHWDYLVTDCAVIKEKYRSCFLLKDEQLVETGYPRIKYLLAHKDDENLKDAIRRELSIDRGQKTVLYVPTWRDYNYQRKDLSYLLNLEKLSAHLGEGYRVLFKDHTFNKKTDNLSGSFINVNNAETQSLLLISDFIVTDYSSVIFDGITIDIPFFIFAKDLDRYQHARGVYEDIFEDIAMWAVTDEEDLANRITCYQKDERYEFIKEKYTHLGKEYSLPLFVSGLLKPAPG